MTANFQTLCDLVHSLMSQKVSLPTPQGKEQKALLEQIRNTKTEGKLIDEEIFEEIKRTLKSKNFSDLVDDLTETLLKTLAENLHDIDTNLTKSALEKLPEMQQKHAAEQKIFKKIYLTEFLLENRCYELAIKTFQKLKEETLETEIYGLYGRIFDLEKQLFYNNLIDSPHLIDKKNTAKTLKKFFEISQRYYALKPQNESLDLKDTQSEQIRQEWKSIAKETLAKIQNETYQEDIFRSFGEWIDCNLKAIEEDTKHHYFKNKAENSVAKFSFYNLLLLYAQVCGKTEMKIEDFEEILDIKAQNEDFLQRDIFDYLFKLNIRIRQYFEVYKVANFGEVKRLLDEIRMLKKQFIYSENLFFTSLGYFLENLILGLEHKFILELQKSNLEIDAYDLLKKQNEKIEQNLKIFSQKVINNLIWRHHLNTILLNFRLCHYNNQEKEKNQCIDSIEQLCQLPNFDNKYPQYFVEVQLMKAVLMKLDKKEQDMQSFFKKIERNDNNKPEVISHTKTDFFKTLKKILLGKDFGKAYREHKIEIKALKPENLLQQAILDFLREGFDFEKRLKNFSQLLEPAIIQPNSTESPLISKINHYQNAVLSYCTYLEKQDWERWKTLFPKIVHKYILLYDHTIEHITNNLSNFFKDRKNVHYAAKTEEMLVKIHGYFVIVPILLSWQHKTQEPYEALVETKFIFDNEGKIKVIEELKITFSKGVF